MSGYLLVRGARQLLTLRGPSEPRRGSFLADLGLVEDGAVLIRDGVIVCVGPTRRLENLHEARQAELLDVSGKVVLPGFVDSHTRLVSGPLRMTEYEMRVAGASPAEIERRGGGPPARARALRESSTRRLELFARRRLPHLIRHGTTTLEIESGYGCDEATELRILKAAAALDASPLDVVPVLATPLATPPGCAADDGCYEELLCSRLLPLVQRRRLARFVRLGVGPCLSLEQLPHVAEQATRLGIGVKVLAGLVPGDGAVRVAVQLGALSVEGLRFLDEKDIAALAGSATVATLLPATAFEQGWQPYPPARALIEAGAAVALASGFDPDASPACSLPVAISLACSQMRMSPAEAIVAATINGAHALGLADRVGSIEPGKQADLVVFDVADYREIPYHFGLNLVSMVLKRGAVLYQQGEILWEPD